MEEEVLEPFKVGDIQLKQPGTKKKEEQEVIFNFPYLESVLDNESGIDKIKGMYKKSYQALEVLAKTINTQDEKEKINRIMKAYDRSMELMNELVEIKGK